MINKGFHFKVGVIVSTYNWEKALAQTLLSIAQQTRLPDQIIIADDGSGMDTQNTINQFKEKHPHLTITHVWHEDDGFRLASIRNKAILQANVDYILQIDGDIILEKHFIADHIRFAEEGYFVTGSRLLLNEKITQSILKSGVVPYKALRWKGTNFFNTFRVPFVTKWLQYSYKTNGRHQYYVKGCHLAFWKKDLLMVNGYNEDFVGWGQEDTDLSIRLINGGLRKKFLKFGAIEYHLFHKIASRNQLSNNNLLLDKAIAEKQIRCNKGLSQ
ncbi:MAG: hypothetical protein RLZ39_1326 [Bacteroidota bacterium]|jgi:glycosyltransferase involved in cell wall biosynthesis